MSDRALSLGFVGGGPNSAAGKAHFSAVCIDGLWSLDAGAFSTQAKRNTQAATIYGVESSRIYSSLGELLKHERERLDAIVILTPTPLHFEMVNSCLHAGFPVICEKALAINSCEAQKIEDLCDEKKAFLAVVYNYSGYPMVRELRHMIREGRLGEILYFQAEMPQEGYLRVDDHGNKPSVQKWRQADGPIPTLYLDLAVHLHQIVFYLTNEKPLQVVADQSSNGWFGAIDNAACLARYTNNVQGQFWFSKCALGYRNGLRIKVYGSKASAEWIQSYPEELLVCYGDGRREILDRGSNIKVARNRRFSRFKAGHPAGFVEALANLYGDIHTALRGYYSTGYLQSDEVFGPALAKEGLIMFESMLRSFASGSWERTDLSTSPRDT